MTAALFVLRGGPYSDIPGVDVWDLSRDARRYSGPHPVVAHPPCERWGRYWYGGPRTLNTRRERKLKGHDSGCFFCALWAVRQFGGVLEHPAESHAWPFFGLYEPGRSGGWRAADPFGGWTCCVDQYFYGHRAQKATWLYACGCDLPELRWGKSDSHVRLDDGFHSADERRRAVRRGMVERLSHRERALTPIPFRDLLLSMARSVHFDHQLTTESEKH